MASKPAAGTLVRARGRDWVVLPSPQPEVVLLRPLTGGDEQVAGLFWPLEYRAVTESRFAPPDPAHVGDAVGSLLLCRETVRSSAGLRAQQQRVRHWAAIALLRCLLSSPDAADAVLSRRRGERARGAVGEAIPDDIDTLYRPQVLDPLGEANLGDHIPTAPVEDAEPYLSDPERRRLAGFRRQAQALADPTIDHKLRAAADAVADLLSDGFRPIVFCRFISTAKYLERMLPRLLGDAFPGLRVVAVTGRISSPSFCPCLTCRNRLASQTSGVQLLGMASLLICGQRGAGDLCDPRNGSEPRAGSTLAAGHSVGLYSFP